MINVFIDGREGTTGLQIQSRLEAREDVRLLAIDEALRKDEAARKVLLNSADCVFLCLPDAAARQAVALIDNPDVVVLDASTAHRTEPGWVYGFPELSPEHRSALKESRRIAVPGCHASGFCALVYPLVRKGLLPSDAALSCTSLTGYSGGGKSMIAQYEGGDPPRGAQPYALALHHKHLPEMTAVCCLQTPPIFSPCVVPVRQGMLVSVPVFLSAQSLHAALAAHYDGVDNVRVMPFEGENPQAFLDMEALNGTDKLEIFVFGHDRQSLLVARLDNLGKGAAGAAVQCMELRFGLRARDTAPDIRP